MFTLIFFTLYSSTRIALTTLSKKFNIKTQLIDLTNLENIESHLSENVKVIFLKCLLIPRFGLLILKKSWLLPKNLNGHSDVIAEVAIAKDKNYISAPKFEYFFEPGGILNSFNAWLLLRGIKTFGIHMEKIKKMLRML